MLYHLFAFTKEKKLILFKKRKILQQVVLILIIYIFLNKCVLLFSSRNLAVFKYCYKMIKRDVRKLFFHIIFLLYKKCSRKYMPLLIVAEICICIVINDIDIMVELFEQFIFK